MPNQFNVIVSQPQSNNLGHSLNSLFEILAQVQTAISGDSITFDFQSIRFAYPALILPVSALIARLEDQDISVRIINNSCSYLETVCFPKGLNPITDNAWQTNLNYYQNRSYLPICAIPTSNANRILRDNIVSVFEQILRRQLNLSPQLQTTVSYLISEAFDNIVEHARIERGWIMAQNYNNLNYLDVCIADSGIGILGSYQRIQSFQISSHEQAIQQAINGVSTKIHETLRGYGIRTSRRMLVRGLNGIFFLLSGNSFYYWSNEHEFIHAAENRFYGRETSCVLEYLKPNL